MSVIAIDPGPVKSAWVTWNGTRLIDKRHEDNELVLALLTGNHCMPEELAIEQIAAMGIRAGNSVFETAYWCGRFCQAWHPRPFARIKRGEVKMFLTGTMRSKDADIRHAIITRFGGKEKAVGSILKKGPLYGVTTHLWSALAVAITWEANQKRDAEVFAFVHRNSATRPVLATAERLKRNSK